MKIRIDVVLQEEDGGSALYALRDIEGTYAGVHGKVIEERGHASHPVMEFEGSQEDLQAMLTGGGYDDPIATYAVEEKYDPSVDYKAKLQDAGITVTSTATGFRLG